MYSTINIDSFEFENGRVLKQVPVGFHTYGKLNKDKSNVVWVCHALTANSDVLDWWGGLFGNDHLFDPEKYFIVCANTLGSCYGTLGPQTPRANTRPLLHDFPFVTTRDMARLTDELRSILGIEKIYALIGPSLGGQQALEFSLIEPERIENLILIATNARHSPYGIAFNESQRLAIETDESYKSGQINGGSQGLAVARSIALLSYRSYQIYNSSQHENDHSKADNFRASGYQKYQGEKLNQRFNAYSYVTLSKAMDSHNVARNRGTIQSALKEITANTLVIGVSSDQLFPINEQRLLSDAIQRSEYGEINSNYGHDGFLIETEALKELMEDFLFNEFRKNKPTVFKTTVRKSQLLNIVG